MEKIVSQLDADGYFVGPVYADADPLVEGGFQILFGCVDLLPPANTDPGKRYKLVGNEWIGEPIPEPTLEPALTAEEISAAEIATQRAETLAAIVVLEAQQARPVREIVAALAAGSALPTIAVDKLAELDTQIADLRKLL